MVISTVGFAVILIITGLISAIFTGLLSYDAGHRSGMKDFDESWDTFLRRLEHERLEHFRSGVKAGVERGRADARGAKGRYARNLPVADIVEQIVAEYEQALDVTT